MKLLVPTIALLLAPAFPAYAQVINGESTYEDNYLHTPPKAPETTPASARGHDPQSIRQSVPEIARPDRPMPRD